MNLLMVKWVLMIHLLDLITSIFTNAALSKINVTLTLIQDQFLALIGVIWQLLMW